MHSRSLEMGLICVQRTLVIMIAKMSKTHMLENQKLHLPHPATPQTFLLRGKWK